MKSILYRDGYKYQLVADYTVQTEVRPDGDIYTKFIDLQKDGTLTIRSGYAWDGASGPTLDTKDTMRGSLVHDALYQLIREKFLSDNFRKAADKELFRVLREDGMWFVRARVWFRALRLAGASAADPRSVKLPCVAP